LGKAFANPQGLNRRWIILLIFFLSVVNLIGQKLEQNLQKPDSLFLGSRFYLSISSDLELLDIVIPDTLTKFSIVNKETLKIRRKPDGLKLTIVPLDTGEQTFPALLIKPVSSIADTLRTEPFTLFINEIRPAQDSVLIDIAPVRKLKSELPVWAYYLIGAMLILAILIAAVLQFIKYGKKHNGERNTASAWVDSRPNWKKALEDLYLLNHEKLPDKGEFIVFHYRLSEIMKVYLESEYGFPANEMTTMEIKRYLKQNKTVLMAEQDKLIKWLESCDKVKFAKHKSGVEDCEKKIDWFMRWLLNNRTTDELDKFGAKRND